MTVPAFGKMFGSGCPLLEKTRRWQQVRLGCRGGTKAPPGWVLSIGTCLLIIAVTLTLSVRAYRRQE